MITQHIIGGNMNKRRILLILINLSFLLASLKYDSVKVGISESLGVLGILSADHKIEKFSNDIYLTWGIFIPLAVCGGAGLTYKRYITNAQPDPVTQRSANLYIISSVFKYYALAMNDIDGLFATGTMGSIGIGLDLVLLKLKDNRKIHIQAGAISPITFKQNNHFGILPYDLSFWPILNLKFSK